MTFLAVDGGGSGIRLRHSALPDPVEVPGVSWVPGQTVRLLIEAITQGWITAGARRADVVILGLSTANFDPHALEELAGAVADLTGAAQVRIADDTVTSHAGALGGEPGISLVVGTGVACLAVDQSGRSPRTFDGHGYLLGDAGSAFWIGAQALGEVTRVHDHGGAIALTAPAIARFGPLDGLAVRLHTGPGAINAIAQFAKDVQGLAATGDPEAGALLDRAAMHLFDTILAAQGFMDRAADGLRPGTAQPPHPVARQHPRPHPIQLALGGQVLAPGRPLRARLDAYLYPTQATFTAHNARGSSLDGAALLVDPTVRERYAGLIHDWALGEAS